ncbi:hypothetical protein [Streptomyces sp. Ru87]|uniref:hypothetical protein n=1 Tax=Streptomyces sp. Ru87 TaxID=2044307 RepID=UPI000BF4C05E|nr:hypothetical protein [Streptomyces sp. Ru87]PGH48140.1 hypothetical protein CRI70_24900 [Streptomyces sp. Ru87]
MLITPRRAAATLLAVLTTVTLAACSTESPPQHQERLRKAAGIRVFNIDCTKDLWETTSKSADAGSDRGSQEGVKGAKVEKGEDGLSRVKLTGPQLADYLRILDFRAHPPTGDGQAESVRMYDEIAKVLDGIKSKPAADAPPPLVVEDGFLPGKD